MPDKTIDLTAPGLTRRERALGHQKGTFTTIDIGTPASNEGADGDFTLRKVSDGLILYIKANNAWYDVNKLKAGGGGLVRTITSTSATPVNNTDVAGVSIIFVNTASYNYVIGGFTGGTRGQVLYILKTHVSNVITLENNEASNNQKIYNPGNADVSLSATYGGITLVCDGRAWFWSGSTIDT